MVVLLKRRYGAIRGNQMAKILETLRNDPSEKNITAARKYLAKHMMAACMLSVEEAAFLRSIGINP